MDRRDIENISDDVMVNAIRDLTGWSSSYWGKWHSDRGQSKFEKPIYAIGGSSEFEGNGNPTVQEFVHQVIQHTKEIQELIGKDVPLCFRLFRNGYYWRLKTITDKKYGNHVISLGKSGKYKKFYDSKKENIYWAG